MPWPRPDPDDRQFGPGNVAGFEHHLGEACIGTISDVFSMQLPQILGADCRGVERSRGLSMKTEDTKSASASERKRCSVRLNRPLSSCSSPATRFRARFRPASRFHTRLIQGTSSPSSRDRATREDCEIAARPRRPACPRRRRRQGPPGHTRLPAEVRSDQPFAVIASKHTGTVAIKKISTLTVKNGDGPGNCPLISLGIAAEKLPLQLPEREQVLNHLADILADGFRFGAVPNASVSFALYPYSQQYSEQRGHQQPDARVVSDFPLAATAGRSTATSASRSASSDSSLKSCTAPPLPR